MVCPRCEHENIEGSDRCSNCMESFRDRDVPQATAGFQRVLMEEPVREIGSPPPFIVSPGEIVASVVAGMKKIGTGCALVEANGELAGIFTEHDILMKLTGEGHGLDEARVEDLMTRGPESVEETDSVRVALHKMAVGGFRNVPITREGRIIGVVTANDALRFLARHAGSQ